MNHFKPRLNIRFKLRDSYIKKNNKKLKEKRGTVLYETSNGVCYVVIFDGAKSKQTYHKDFIELI